jgi:hypothetical protein
LRESISQVHGLSLARSLIALEDPLVWGFASPLTVSFPTRRYLHVAVNGRVVDTDSFAPAISKAYADLLPKPHNSPKTKALEAYETGHGGSFRCGVPTISVLETPPSDFLDSLRSKVLGTSPVNEFFSEVPREPAKPYPCVVSMLRERFIPFMRAR